MWQTFADATVFAKFAGVLPISLIFITDFAYFDEYRGWIVF